MGSCLSKCLIASTSKGKELMTREREVQRALQAQRGGTRKQKDKRRRKRGAKT